MKKNNRYKTSHLAEDQYEPGSRKQVLKNRIGIKSKSEMDQIEALALQQAEDAFLRGTRRFAKDHKFNVKDICDIHGVWLSNIYEWAGKFREVKMSKGNFTFAMPAQIPKLMETFEKNYLSKYTPCNFGSKKGTAGSPELWRL